MTMIKTWTTDDGATVEVHDTTWAGYEGDGTSLAHLKAYNELASVVLPVSKGLLDDERAIRHYINIRLLLFLQIETERVEAQGATQ